jgi:hypothetical protein
VQRAIRYAQNKGALTVASAGNANVDLQHKFIDSISPDDGSSPVEIREINAACLDLPAEAPGVVTVSAVGTERLKSYYSSYGQGVVDVSAPGGDTRRPNPAVSTTANAVLSTVIGPPTSCPARRACTTRAQDSISSWLSAPAGIATASMVPAR